MLDLYAPRIVAKTEEGGFAANVEVERRKDRKAEEFRPIYIKAGIATRASGSCYIEIGHTKVIVSVYGPRADSRPQREFTESGDVLVDFKYAPYCRNGRRERGQNSTERVLSGTIRQALISSVLLSKFPKAVLDVNILVLEDDGGEVAAAIAASSVAIANAGVEMTDLVASCQTSLVDDEVLLDPSYSEEKNAKLSVLISLLATQEKVSHLEQRGHGAKDELQEALDLAQDGCKKVHSLMQTALLRTLKD